MTSAAVNSSVLGKIAQEVASSLATATASTTSSFIATPLVYPSGTSVVVRLDGSGIRFFVSDYGMGFQEAMMMNASHSYTMIAHGLIRDTGISFDHRSFFVAEAARDELAGVVSAVANCSQRAVIETALIHEARKLDVDRNLLIERLQAAFGQKRVEKDVEIRGASTIKWDVTARVATSDSVVMLFDYAKPHKNSVSNTVAKFHDIARLSVPPRRIVTIRDTVLMDCFVGLLSQSAHVIELAATPDEALRALAA